MIEHNPMKVSKNIQPPSISLPKGGGSIRGIDETFTANPATGMASSTIPIYTTQSRSSLSPQLALAYQSGSGNGAFGMGWKLSLPSITRKTDKGLPKYQDQEHTDVFLLTGVEDLVPETGKDGRHHSMNKRWKGEDYHVIRYKPRIEQAFSRIEHWAKEKSGETHWRVISKQNVTQIYGDSAKHRIVDPEQSDRVYSWLLSRTYDDKGNLVVYEYKQEDRANVREHVYEQNRNVSANRYIKRIYYGYQTPYEAAKGTLPEDWHFQVVFDYGEHSESQPAVEEETLWDSRIDAFSTYRSRFEIRTLRRCRRILMFHRFDELGEEPCLVRSTDFTYSDGKANETDYVSLSFLASATVSGYIRHDHGYEKKSMPSLEFEYSQPVVDERVQWTNDIHKTAFPHHLNQGKRQWVDLDSEGLTGILTEQEGALYYVRNAPRYVSDGPAPEVHFFPAEKVGQWPLTTGSKQLLDLEGGGTLCAVDFESPIPGYYERKDQNWESFHTFDQLPRIDWKDSNLRFVDLNGDGLADILIIQDEIITWYPSIAKQGFLNEHQGPRVVFRNEIDTIYLADMSGDGLADLVRIRNGEICYWPNCGYGHFGTLIQMAHSPYFAHPDQFDQQRIKLADIDGSGHSDLVYVGSDAIKIYFNREGNQWSQEMRLKDTPEVHDFTDVHVLDLLGTGTACIVGVTNSAEQSSDHMWYIDLMGSTKPYLLTSTKNNRGLERRVHYASSTKFYVKDRLHGKPWFSKLPFPVHVVEKMEVFDWISRTTFTTRYSYHHGYYDGLEREFNGFGRVEQWDSEFYTTLSKEEETNVLPPIRKVHWFHNGAFLHHKSISKKYETEYYNGDHEAQRLQDTVFPTDLTVIEAREACRALKGSLLRTEIYAEDDNEHSVHPYQTIEYGYLLKKLQAGKEDQHAVFFVQSAEKLSYLYERDPSDPRVNHEIVLSFDNFGNVTRSADIAYPRRPGPVIKPEQEQLAVTVLQNRFLNKAEEENWYRCGIRCESLTYELLGIPSDQTFMSSSELNVWVDDAETIDYGAESQANKLQKRIIAHSRTLYRRDDLAGPLPFGEVESMALSYQSYKLALTTAMVEDVYGAKVNDQLLMKEGNYVQVEGNGNWWVPSSRQLFSPNEDDGPSEEWQYAKAHFFVPHRLVDPYGNTTTIYYDRYHQLVEKTIDPLGNTTKAINHYRTMLPQVTTDPNHNGKAVRFDALGNVSMVFQLGKPEQQEGDIFDTEKTEQSGLDDPSFKVEYDLFQWQLYGQPPVSKTYTREYHRKPDSAWQETYQYVDGMNRKILTKVQADPGVAPARDEQGYLQKDTNGNTKQLFTASRWIGTGRVVYDNKGNPVKQFEPFYDCSPSFHDEEELVYGGVTKTLRYDPLGRLTRTDFPNGTFSFRQFNSWQEVNWDANDTVLESTWFAQQESPAPSDPEPYEPTKRAAWLAAKHANTPNIHELDPLGRSFLTIIDNGTNPHGQKQNYVTRTEFDVQGNVRSIIDAKGRQVAKSKYNLIGTLIHSVTIDSGESWMLHRAEGDWIRSWDSKGQTYSRLFDSLNRQTHMYIKLEDGKEILTEYDVYGEQVQFAEHYNLRGKHYQWFDSSGVTTNVSFDFKGNLLQSSRRLTNEYKTTVDWSILEGLSDPSAINQEAKPLLENEAYIQTKRYDALNRTILATTPHHKGLRPNVIQPTYNKGNLLQGVYVWLHCQHIPDTPWPRQTADEVPVQYIEYDAKGQRTRIDYGNEVQTRYDYDPQTFRLVRKRTTRRGEQFSRNEQRVQDLTFTYDPVGNVTTIEDQADLHNTVFFRNQRIEPNMSYEYDPLYRLLKATGREHLGQTEGRINPPRQMEHEDGLRTRLIHPGDGNALGRYTEYFDYDEVSNLLSVSHRGSRSGWKRTYEYEENSNRLRKTNLPGDPETGPYSGQYHYDELGNMTSMPHLSSIEWSEQNRMRSTARQMQHDGTPETTYYVYDAGGQRIRKITETSAPEGQRSKVKQERIYLGGFELYREYAADGQTVQVERETLHVSDDQQRMMLIEMKRIDLTDPADLNIPLLRYQFDNHLGSACLELDQHAAVISYEEFTSYGATSYQAVNAAIQSAAKRYRYTGKERDENTGLYYYGSRYYAAWLGRWISADPAGFADGLNRYEFVRSNPVNRFDPDGRQSDETISLMERFRRWRHATVFTAAMKLFSAETDPGLPDENIPRENPNYAVSQEVQRKNRDEHTKSSEIGGDGNSGGGDGGDGGNGGNSGDSGDGEGRGNDRNQNRNQTRNRRMTEAETLDWLEEREGPAFDRPRSTDELRERNAQRMAESRSNRQNTSQSQQPARQTQSTTRTSGLTADSGVSRSAGNLSKGLSAVDKALGPLSLGYSVYQFGTAETTLDRANASVSVVGDTLGLSPHPVAQAASFGIAGGQILDQTLGVSDYSSAAGVAVYSQLNEWGMNENLSFTAGGFATLAATGPAIGYAGAQKVQEIGSAAAQNITVWIGAQINW